MMVLCCFPRKHLKQSVYSLDKYSKKFMSVKTLKHFRTSFAYERSVSRSDGSLCGWLQGEGKMPSVCSMESLFSQLIQIACATRLSPCLEHT